MTNLTLFRSPPTTEIEISLNIDLFDKLCQISARRCPVELFTSIFQEFCTVSFCTSLVVRITAFTGLLKNYTLPGDAQLSYLHLYFRSFAQFLFARPSCR